MSNITEAIKTLKKGGLIIVADDEDREAEGDLVGLAEYVTPEAVNFMIKFGRGLICAPISKKIAQHLSLEEMTTHNTDAFGTAFTISVDHKHTKTGISAFDRATSIKALADPRSKSSDFLRPGHIFPLISVDGGTLIRRGHTEAAIDLAKLANSIEAAYICEILKEDGTMARMKDLTRLSKEWQLPLITIDELVNFLEESSHITVNLPTDYGDFKLTIYEEGEKLEHLLLTKGDIQNSQSPTLVRVHSECLTGDVFGSHRCDCGEQLHEAMRMIAEEGTGAILYLRQEGRGIGLRNKLKAYQLQEQGFDTYEANIELGFAPDERDYHFATDILKSIGTTTIRLLTNNPDKVTELQKAGITIVERVPIETFPQKENQAYLKTKKDKFNHYLSL
ncbi:GTP cyclohydrolase II [Enterococcus mundtii]|uniref:GTP cyclohydrolase II n=1 Tax=Enterococcus TaxID=1350 RepID=UPI002542C484|nr:MULTISPECIES: GTP cyclohydrolase II [Enterococcus]MDK4210142.1 GTP cyclohydrolase II [Enterococcus mundtii]MDO7878285.1 GTP cyclohydrolase II [Enterococcus mundtii]MEC3941976.1 GTP cyclohydrolase II [Enterococcus mundtii]